ncbi:MAG: efflux RND transporter permease subunit, partial [Bdellovibrionales bacterium]
NALMKGMRAVIAPVTVGVTTTMAAFGPLAFSTGTLGQIIMIIPVVVIPILFISLMEAYFILPAHLSSPSRWSRGIVAQTRNTVTKLLRAFVAKIIMPVSGFAMRWRYVAVAAFIGFAIITGGMFKGGMIRFIFFPQVESDEVKISVTMPTGTPFEMTQETLLTIEKAAQDVRTEIGQDDLYENMTVSIGQTSGGGGPGGGRAAGKADNIGEVILRLISSDFRAQSALDIETMIRERVEDLPNVEKMEFQSSLVGDDPDIEVELSHADEAMLNQAAEELKEKLRAIKGTTEVADSYEPGKTEYVFELTQEGLAVGLTPQRLGSELRAAFFGLEAERFQRGRSEIIVYVRYPKEQRENLATLYSTRIRLDDGTQVPLSSVARIKKQTGYAQISTVNGRQVVSVTADADYNITTPNDVIAQMRQTLLPALAEHYPGLSYSFEGKNREQAEDLANLGRNMMIALMIIYVILGAQLHSYVQPLLIMTAIPFGVVGAIWGHFLLGHDLTFISLFGIVALSGVVVNDSVVLVDYYNKQIEDGETPHDAALNAISRRFRPILLTTLTTALGLLPVLLETSLQAQFLIPMVISLATGILFSTVIILLLIPCLVVILEDIKSLGRTIAAKFPAPS